MGLDVFLQRWGVYAVGKVGVVAQDVHPAGEKIPLNETDLHFGVQLGVGLNGCLQLIVESRQSDLDLAAGAGGGAGGQV